MDDEVEDLIGDVKYTDSQKSVTTSAVYSLDFTDSSSDKNNSSGKETYIIDHDSDDSEETFNIHNNMSIIDLTSKNSNENHQISAPTRTTSINRAASTSLHKCSILSQEIFTQTSKTIIEIAQSEALLNKPNFSLETQTSFVSITENKTVEYKIHLFGANDKQSCEDTENPFLMSRSFCNKNFGKGYILCNQEQSLMLDESTSNKNTTESENNIKSNCCENLDKEIIHFIEDETSNDLKNADLNDNTSEFESSLDSSLENDSLMENKFLDRQITKSDSEIGEVNISIDNDVEELYHRLSRSPQLLSPLMCVEPPVRKFGLLTPLTEETQKRDSILDLTPSMQTLTKSNTNDDEDNDDSQTLFVHNSGVRVKVLSNSDREDQYKQIKLPPIQNNHFYSNSPKLNFLFTAQAQDTFEKSRILPYIYENQNNYFLDRWEMQARQFACGEHININSKHKETEGPINAVKDHLHLPPINHLEGNIEDRNYRTTINSAKPRMSSNLQYDEINIQGKIKELKINTQKTRHKFSSRSGSPSSLSSPDDTKISDAAEKGCDGLTSDLLRRLRSSSWTEISETLMDIPKAMEKFWPLISEFRLADLLRQVTAHIESPRTQVARSACKAVAEILKNTNYTKKPDFYEAVSMLLTKTGSYNRPVRREANVALDSIVCSVDITHCISAICVYGVSHKSALVRCASARLLVVCCALAAGGRRVLRARPPSVAAARTHALRSLAELLQDRNTDTRKYADRLYAMLRPLSNFEAFFLTDVDVDVASKLMRKFDKCLLDS